MSDKFVVKPFINMGYLLIGDTREADYNDVFFVNSGFVYSVSSQTSFSVAYDYQQTTTNTVDEARSVALYANQHIHQQWSASAYLFKGLTSSVADTGLGFTLIRSF